MQEHLLIAGSEDKGSRLDVYISEQLDDLSRSFAGNLILKELVTVNGILKKGGYSIKEGDRIVVTVPEPQVISTEPQDIPIDIIYEDDFIAVINKPKGLVVHPAQGAYSGTLVNALLYHLSSLSSINGIIRPGIVHRLDKDTTGLLVVAKNDEAHVSLAKQISEKSAIRLYRAILDGILREDKGSIIAPVGRSHKDRKKMAVVADGRFAHTDYTVLERFKNKTYAEFQLHTGRTHQIRVHAKHIGHPVTGDGTYGGDISLNSDGQLLHANKLILTHPISGEIMEFEAPLPEGFQDILIKLRQ